MPIPLGHCGQLTSPPIRGPLAFGTLTSGTLGILTFVVGLGEAFSLAAGLSSASGCTLGATLADGALSACLDFGLSGASQPVAKRTAGIVRRPSQRCLRIVPLQAPRLAGTGCHAGRHTSAM